MSADAACPGVCIAATRCGVHGRHGASEAHGTLRAGSRAAAHRYLVLGDAGPPPPCSLAGRCVLWVLKPSLAAAAAEPKPVDGLEGVEVAGAAAGLAVSGAFSKEGAAWLWGFGTSNQLGKGDDDEGAPGLGVCRVAWR